MRQAGMKLGPTCVLMAVVLAAVCGCETPPAYKQPPAGSYTTAARQMKIGEAVTSVQGAAVTLDFFKAAEVRPMLGRFFVDGEQESSGARVAVLSHDLWTERFGGAPDIIGQNIQLDGRQTVVVGITPRGFRIPDGALLWTPRASEAP